MAGQSRRNKISSSSVRWVGYSDKNRLMACGWGIQLGSHAGKREGFADMNLSQLYLDFWLMIG